MTSTLEQQELPAVSDVAQVAESFSQDMSFLHPYLQRKAVRKPFVPRQKWTSRRKRIFLSQINNTNAGTSLDEPLKQVQRNDPIEPCPDKMETGTQ